MMWMDISMFMLNERSSIRKRDSIRIQFQKKNKSRNTIQIKSRLKAGEQLPAGGGNRKGQENKITKVQREILGVDGYFHFLDYSDQFTHKYVCVKIYSIL